MVRAVEPSSALPVEVAEVHVVLQLVGKPNEFLVAAIFNDIATIIAASVPDQSDQFLCHFLVHAHEDASRSEWCLGKMKLFGRETLEAETLLSTSGKVGFSLMLTVFSLMLIVNNS